jgi:serine/threonine-protein kinase RsbW
MTGSGDHTTGETLELQSRISDLARVPAWIECLASQHSIPESTKYAMNLCLEEALANIVVHGYAAQPDFPIAIHFTAPREGYFVFVVEDQAPPFNPVDAPELPMIHDLDEIQSGGQGLRLLRRFSDRLDYQPTPAGNRLSIGFSSAHTASANN